MKNLNKGSVSLLAVLFIALVAIGCGAYVYLKMNAPTTETPTNTDIGSTSQATTTISQNTSVEASVPAKSGSKKEEVNKVVTPTYSITVLSPNTAETYKIGDTVKIAWKHSNNLHQRPFSICLYSETEGCVREISNSVSYNNLSYDWKIGSDVKPGKYKVTVANSYGFDNAVYDRSDVFFTIAASLLRVCPEKKVDNRMPRIYPSNDTSASTYFILNTERRELVEFDLNWVNTNCTVEEEVVY